MIRTAPISFIILGLLLFSNTHVYSQTIVPAEERRRATKDEVKDLADLSDSLMKELKLLYIKELKEKSPNKYQPERIALVGSYLQIFQLLQSSSDVVAYTKNDIFKILGKPDNELSPAAMKGGEFQLYYGRLERPYVRISNLKYQLTFSRYTLVDVKRE